MKGIKNNQDDNNNKKNLKDWKIQHNNSKNTIPIRK